MSIVCRGKPTSQEEVFAYTNGRFLGGLSKALLMTREGGSELIAKVPCRIAGPAFLTTASEVGTLEYIRRYTSIPVPRVFSWSPDNSNPVGAEYIVMEKAIRVPLFERWGEMTEIEKLELIKHLTQLEAQLSAIGFPAYGVLYLRADADCLERQDLDGDVDKQHLFCVGPSPDRSFDVDTGANIPTEEGSVNNGPWNNLSDLGISIAKRAFSQLAKQSLDNRSVVHRGGPQEQARLLEVAVLLMRMLDSHPITTLIDVQSLSVLPLFLQARWPVFLQPPQDYTRGFVQPVLSRDFDSLNEEDKAAALHDWTQAKLAKAYEVSTFLENRLAHDAMAVPRVLRELFIRVGEISDTGIVPLRDCLIEISQNWSNLGFWWHCPYSFSHEEISVHERQFAKYQKWSEVQQLALESLDTDAEGWVAPQLDFDRKRSQNKELLAIYMTRMAGEMSPEEARRIWPFPEE
ncbi:hypothetical protein BDV09DRAFT_186722 [Aspergillus tetrazonus]